MATTKRPVKIIKPQDGYQMLALASEADIVIGGAAAGVGKTYTLLLDPLYDIKNPRFGGVIFRRTSPQIRSQGGLWDTSFELYHGCGAQPKETTLEWLFPSGASMKFSHLEYEKNIYDWQGAQVPFIGFDELPHFSSKMFWYLLSRNRSTCGVKPRVRATCNPDPDSWVAALIGWWIDPDTGLPIPARNGVIRYFIKYGQDFIWGDSYDEVQEKAAHILEPLLEKSGLQASDFIKSITFISGSIYDNKALISKNPEYLGNLLSQDEATRLQLLDGNWKMQISDNDIYNYYSFAGVFDNVREVETASSYITADIAMKGSNKLIILVWRGSEVVDIEIMDKSDGKQVIDAISTMAKFWNVENRYICYDADGVGSYIDGFIRNAVPFNGGIPAIAVSAVKKFTNIETPVFDHGAIKQRENYFNLKTQCYYRSGERVNRGDMKISSHVAEKMYDDKMTVRQRFMYERKAIKRDKVDNDGKLKILPKEQMKVMLAGDSPDLMDALMMREMFDLMPVFHYNDANY